MSSAGVITATTGTATAVTTGMLVDVDDGTAAAVTSPSFSITSQLAQETTALAGLLSHDYPRIGAFEVSNGSTMSGSTYRAAIAKYHVVVNGLWVGWSGGGLNIRQAVQDVKSRADAISNPIVMGNYTNFNSVHPTDGAYAVRYSKMTSEAGAGSNSDWLARKASGATTSSFGTHHEVNTVSVTPDAGGLTAGTWLCEYYDDEFFTPVPEFDFQFIDNWFYRPRVTPDWDGDGDDDAKDTGTVNADLRQGYADILTKMITLQPNLFYVANADGNHVSNLGMLQDAEYVGTVNSIYEGMLGETWSAENQSGGWAASMGQYQTTLNNTKDGFIIANARGASVTDYQMMRYGLCSVLMDAGYYMFTASPTYYKGALWFDEYDFNLGQPIDAAQTTAYENGVFGREFDNGFAAVNPKGNGTQTITLPSAGVGFHWALISGSQDSTTNSGATVTQIVGLLERDGRVVRRVAD